MEGLKCLKGFKHRLPVIREISHGDVMHSMIIVNYTELHI